MQLAIDNHPYREQSVNKCQHLAIAGLAANGSALSSAEDFIGHASIIVGKSHNNLIETRKP